MVLLEAISTEHKLEVENHINDFKQAISYATHKKIFYSTEFEAKARSMENGNRFVDETI